MVSSPYGFYRGTAVVMAADVAAHDLQREGSSALLVDREMTPLMAEFFAGLADPGLAAQWATYAMKPGREAREAENARLAGKFGVEIRVRRVDYRGQDLRNKDFAGADLEGAPRLGDLVAEVLRRVPDLPRLRISSIDSIEADPRLMETIATEPRLMPHLHLSLQAGDDLILKRMKRRHLRADAIAFCHEARAARPEIVFGADIIAGFPTETEAMFQNSLRLVEECGLTWLHVFPYSARAGTPAARMPQVDGAVARERAARLRAAGAERVVAHLAEMRGRPAKLLMERPDIGRTEGFAPTRLATPAAPGSIVTARIVGHEAGQLLAEAV